MGHPESIGSMIKGKMKISKDSHPCVALLNRRWTGEINEAEFNKELAYWCAGNLLEFKHRGMPTPPPDLLQVYSVTRKGGFKVTSDFYQRDDVKRYMDMKNAIKMDNKASLDFLDGIIAFIPEEDVVIRTKMQERVDELTSQYNADRDPTNVPSF